jgi:hypothetical protein
MNQRKILRVISELRKELPLSTNAFEKKFKQLTGCELINEYSNAKDFKFISDEITIIKYSEIKNAVYCESKCYTIELKDFVEVSKETIEERVNRESWIICYKVHRVYKCRD